MKDPYVMKLFSKALETADEIFFTGGEPLLIKEHEKVLKHAIDIKTAQNIRIKYNSNLTRLSHRFLDLWRHFREVEFNCSIEAAGASNDYIRWPSKWKTIEKSIQTLDHFADKYPHIKVYIHSTFQALNLFKVPDLLKWVSEARWQNIHRMPHFIYLHEPRWLRASVLPKNLRDMAIDKIEEALSQNRSYLASYREDHSYWSNLHLNNLSSCVRRLRAERFESALLKEFKHYTRRMDLFRKQDVKEVIPELIPVFH